MSPENSPQIIVPYQIFYRKISPQRTAPGITATPRKIVLPPENCALEKCQLSNCPPEDLLWRNTPRGPILLVPVTGKLTPENSTPENCSQSNCPMDYSFLDNCPPKIPLENWPLGIVAPWMKYVPSSSNFFAFCEEQNLPCYFAVFAKAK